MAVRVGTASNHIALWEELLDFLQNDDDLVSTGQAWEVAWESPTQPDYELVLKGPGVEGGNEVYVGLRLSIEPQTAGESQIHIMGMTGVIPAAATYAEHVNALGWPPLIFLDHNPMKYWMVANGRRFVLVLNISTIYQAAYAGFFLPYGTPTAYPYPLFIGGTRSNSGTTSLIPSSWRDTGPDNYRHFVYPSCSSGGINVWDSQSFMLDPAGLWREGSYRTEGSLRYTRFTCGGRTFPDSMGNESLYPIAGRESDLGPLSDNGRLGYATVMARTIAGLNGEMPLIPVPLTSWVTSSGATNPTIYGVLDGVFIVPGLGNAAENIVTINGVDHLVVQNVQRTNSDEYWALALE